MSDIIRFLSFIYFKSYKFIIHFLTFEFLTPPAHEPDPRNVPIQNFFSVLPPDV